MFTYLNVHPFHLHSPDSWASRMRLLDDDDLETSETEVCDDLQSSCPGTTKDGNLRP